MGLGTFLPQAAFAPSPHINQAPVQLALNLPFLPFSPMDAMSQWLARKSAFLSFLQNTAAVSFTFSKAKFTTADTVTK